jgi:hypothetical protein
MKDFGTLVATGKVTRIKNSIGWGVFEDNEIGIETFDMPLSPAHHKPDDDIKWYHAGGAKYRALVIGDEFMSLFSLTLTDEGYAFDDGYIVDRSMEVVGYYE